MTTTTRFTPFLKFSLVGVLNTIVDLAAFAFLTALDVPLLLAHCAAYGCGMANSYALNKSWTFQARTERATSFRLLRFIAVNLVALACSYALLSVLCNGFHLPVMLGKLAATSAGLFLNFLGSRYLVFNS